MTDLDPTHELLFDLAREGLPNLVWLVGGGVIALAATLAWIWQRRRRGRAHVVVRFVALAFGAMAAVAALSVWDHHRLLAALDDGRTRVVEAPLESHTVQQRARYSRKSSSYDRSVAESFFVGDVAFGFVRDASVPGFTNSGETPVVLANGQTLRVHYVEDTPGDFASRRIVRLERRRPAGATGIGLAGLAGLAAAAASGR